MVPAGFRATEDVRSWGRAHRGLHHLAQPSFTDEIAPLIEGARAAGMSVLPRGLGRAYGDSGLNIGQATIDVTRLDRVLAFDSANGVLRAEAGASLGQLIPRILPHGWFLPTTPGTQFVTLGGAVANDVHGKNHHRAGTFGAAVRRLGLQRSDRGHVELSPQDEPSLFAATIGGLGLTGLILWVEVQLARVGSRQIDQETIPFGGLDEFLTLAQESEAGFEHTVAWVDCAARPGRGLYSRGNWRGDGDLAIAEERRSPSLPFDLPGLALNAITLRAFNRLYFHRGSHRRGPEARPYQSVFYPLDAIGGWNRLYGARGFYQHQSVTPPQAGVEAVREMLSAVAAAGEGSFLAVLKTFCDKPSPGMLSFPRPGVTLALDFANRGETTLALLSRLDDIVLAAGGRIYPAKDGRAPPAVFKAGFPNLGAFTPWVDPAFSSSFWRRMGHG